MCLHVLSHLILEEPWERHRAGSYTCLKGEAGGMRGGERTGTGSGAGLLEASPEVALRPETSLHGGVRKRDSCALCHYLALVSAAVLGT